MKAGGIQIDSRCQGLDCVNQLSFRLGSTTTCHSSHLPSKKSSNFILMLAEGHWDGGPYLRKQGESLLLKALSPGILVPLNHLPDSGQTEIFSLVLGHCMGFTISSKLLNLMPETRFQKKVGWERWELMKSVAVVLKVKLFPFLFDTGFQQLLGHPFLLFSYTGCEIFSVGHWHTSLAPKQPCCCDTCRIVV